MDQNLIFDIAELLSKPQGAADEYTLDNEIYIDDPEIKPKGNLKGKLRIMKLDREFNVEFRDLEIEIEAECSKCLKKFNQKISIPYAEKQYVTHKDPPKEIIEEIGYVNTKNQTINIEVFLREEIILHFPLISVCSTHCKGINLEKNG